jgi:hemerythrin-like domain-containing protein
MDLPDFRMPAGGFADPLELWSAAHQRAQRVGLLVRRLFDHVRDQPPSAASRTTAAEIRRYMREAGPRHHADEHDDLFPRLRKRLAELPRGRGRKTLSLMAQLEHDEPELLRLWRQVDAALVCMDTQPPTEAHQAAAAEFVDRFLHHHHAEDQLLSGVAREVLSATDLAEIGAAMAARRGTTWARIARAPASVA